MTGEPPGGSAELGNNLPSLDAALSPVRSLAALHLRYLESPCRLLLGEHLSEPVCCVGHSTVGTQKL